MNSEQKTNFALFASAKLNDKKIFEQYIDSLGYAHNCNLTMVSPIYFNDNKQNATYLFEPKKDNPTFVLTLEYRDFKLAYNTLNLLLFDKTEWLDECFIEQFEMKYKNISLKIVDEISLLMYEASLFYSDDKVIYDMYKAARINLYGIYDNVYLLEKAIYYCNSYFYPLKIFFEIEKDAKYFDDFRLLADALRTIYDKFAVEITDALILDKVKKLLHKSKELSYTNHERMLLSFSYLQNGYIDDAEILIQPTTNAIVDSIKQQDMDYKSIHLLICDIHNQYMYKNDDNDIMHKWFLESTNRLYGAFDEHKC